MDILGALQAIPTDSGDRCRIGAFLDSIPANEPGRDELVHLVETPHRLTTSAHAAHTTRSAKTMAVVLSQLGCETTQNPIHNHRNQQCRCYR